MRRSILILIPLFFLALLAPPADAQVERHYHPAKLPAEHNWQFRAHYPAVDRLINAFDFGHGILYEELYVRPEAPVERLEIDIYQRLTRQILLNPPRMPMPEESFMPRYARLVPLAVQMFEWAHALHRQVYDILADPRVEDRDAALDEVYRHYMSSRLAFTDVPKSMWIMDEQYFSKEFREKYPRFNGLIWAYHWLQIAIHEPFMHTDDPEELQAGMTAVKARFWQMVANPPEALPIEMPMTPAIAPEFTRRYPRIAAIFDNLHMMHDVISDILVSDLVDDKRAEIYRQADLFRDPEFDAMEDDAWIAMAIAHGLDAQGGPAVRILPPSPTLDAEPMGHEHHHHGDHLDADHNDDHDGHDHEGDDDHELHPPEHRHDPDPEAHHHHQDHHLPTMTFLIRLLEDPQVERRLHADHARHMLWEDESVQRHLAMMLEAVETGEMPDHDDDYDHDDEIRPGDHHHHPTMELFVRMLADPEVEARIHADPELHRLWAEPGVREHLEMMREMYPVDEAPAHHHHDH